MRPKSLNTLMLISAVTMLPMPPQARREGLRMSEEEARQKNDERAARYTAAKAAAEEKRIKRALKRLGQ